MAMMVTVECFFIWIDNYIVFEISTFNSGSHGQMTRYALLKKADVEKLIAIKLKKRASAPKRIGCSYRLKECDHAPDVKPRDWFDEQLVSRGINDEWR